MNRLQSLSLVLLVLAACGGPQKLGVSGATCFRDDDCEAGMICVAPTLGDIHRVCSKDATPLISMVEGPPIAAAGTAAAAAGTAGAAPTAGSATGGNATAGTAAGGNANAGSTAGGNASAGTAGSGGKAGAAGSSTGGTDTAGTGGTDAGTSGSAGTAPEGGAPI